MSDILIGSHVSMSQPDYLLGSLEEALSYGANAFMIYTGAPQNSVRTPLQKLKINEFWEGLKQSHISLDNVLVHAPYIMNVASGDVKKRSIGKHILSNEVTRANAIKAKCFIMHPGNAIGISKQTAIANIANVINEVNKTNKNIVICLETMAGKGSEVGGNFQEIRAIINLVENKHLIGVCLDTCHIHDAGYDVKNINGILKEFDEIIGLKFLKVMHINDSKNQRGDKKDRHENIGYGHIGFETFVK